MGPVNSLRGDGVLEYMAGGMGDGEVLEETSALHVFEDESALLIVRRGAESAKSGVPSKGTGSEVAVDCLSAYSTRYTSTCLTATQWNQAFRSRSKRQRTRSVGETVRWTRVRLGA